MEDEGNLLTLILETLKTIAAMAIPLVIFFIGERLNRRQERLERKYSKRIELSIDGNFMGPQDDNYIVEFSIYLDNKGNVQQRVDAIRLKVQGIESGKNISLCTRFDLKYKNGFVPKNRIPQFSEPLVDTDILHNQTCAKVYFVEPGVNQRFSYIALIPSNIAFIRVATSFKYHEKSKHSAQKVFRLPIEIINDVQ